jgi:hypothetical protein
MSCSGRGRAAPGASPLNSVFYGRNGTLRLVALRCEFEVVVARAAAEARATMAQSGPARCTGWAASDVAGLRASIMAPMVRASRAGSNALVRPRSEGRGATAVEQQDAADEPIARMEARR